MRFDWGEFKVPEPTGKIPLLTDMLKPGFVMPIGEMAFRFLGGKRDEGKIGDFAEYMGIAFFISENAFKIFQPMLESSGQCWPMPIGKYKYRFVFIDAIEHGFDRSRSNFDIMPSGAINNMRRLRLVDTFDSDRDIFRLTGEPGVTGHLIVSETFRAVCERNNFTGLFFQPVSGQPPLPPEPSSLLH